MNARQVQKWERTRQIGRGRFILYYGVLGWGLICGMLYALIDQLLHNEPFSWDLFMIPLIVFPLGGIWMGNRMWKRSERAYELRQKATQEDRHEAG